MKKLSKLLFSRVFMVGFSILLQLLWLTYILYSVSLQSTFINWGVRVFAIVLALYITTNRTNPSMKLAWVFLILFLPIVGIMLYFIFGRSGLTKRSRERMDRVNQEIIPLLPDGNEITKELEQIDIYAARQSGYLTKWAGFPLYKNTETNYYISGEKMFPDMLKALEEAKHFIFLEYFIFAKGVMFDRIIEILMKKVKEGVDVRIIYDDVGCAFTLPRHFYKTLQNEGIKCAAFNIIRPSMSIIMNNRDHRKIFVVDGKTAFTGGINIADEYINRKHRFGYWKDTGIRLEGEAVWSFTAMFLEMWNFINRSREDYTVFMPKNCMEKYPKTDGYVQPYGDTPLDNENVGENVYMNIIGMAKDYVYIFTPYLIIDHELFSMLCAAVRRGVDVRIVTPGIPDKKIIFALTQSNFPELIENGIKIYEFTPGFVHAKCFVSDDKIATVGSINLDYRSLYLHFECGVFMYGSKAVLQVRDDILNTIEKSREVTSQDFKRKFILYRLIEGVLNLFAPLL